MTNPQIDPSLLIGLEKDDHKHHHSHHHEQPSDHPKHEKPKTKRGKKQ